MSSGSPNESTASRLQRIARQADALPEDRQVPAEEYEDNVEEGEEPTHDQEDLYPVDQLDHFVELDEPEVWFLRKITEIIKSLKNGENTTVLHYLDKLWFDEKSCWTYFVKK